MTVFIKSGLICAIVIMILQKGAVIKVRKYANKLEIKYGNKSKMKLMVNR